MNILIKLMSIVALVLAPWFGRVHNLAGEGETQAARALIRWLLGVA
jgi:hypothetical protein